MHYEIKILCPGRKCGKCRRLITRVEEVIKSSGVEAGIEIIDDINEMLKYPTWILPTLIINNKTIARGYVPTKENIFKQLTVLNA
jgi:hypothetical protein